MAWTLVTTSSADAEALTVVVAAATVAGGLHSTEEFLDLILPLNFLSSLVLPLFLFRFSRNGQENERN